ncbi:MAG TPA: pyridoxine 5'-phosphate synthase [Calditrichia bacterium]|nr:pyridoxine 5'-phosphate synthase [Calditrichota bacterium]HQV33835.1 pyridoxine 5'-phosphate synthase [Calditrichia bacterium]
MKKLIVSVDDIATLRYSLNDSDIDPVQFAVLAEVAGANGIMATLTENKSGIQERDASLIKKLSKSFFNLHIPADTQFIKQALAIKPDMVTFVEITRAENVRLAPLSASNITDVLGGVLSDFHASNISVATLCYPEIAVLKQLSRVQIDCVAFDCSEYTQAQDSNEELVALDKLRSTTLGAAKLGIGVNYYGGLDYGHLSSLARIPRVEDLTLGLNLIKRALLVGVERAVLEARQLIMVQENVAG